MNNWLRKQFQTKRTVLKDVFRKTKGLQKNGLQFKWKRQRFIQGIMIFERTQFHCYLNKGFNNESSNFLYISEDALKGKCELYYFANKKSNNTIIRCFTWSILSSSIFVQLELSNQSIIELAILIIYENILLNIPFNLNSHLHVIHFIYFTTESIVHPM